MKRTWIFKSLISIPVISALVICAIWPPTDAQDHAAHRAPLVLSDDGCYYTQDHQGRCWKYVQGFGGDTWTSSDRPAAKYFKPGTWVPVPSLPSGFLICDLRTVEVKDGKPTVHIEVTQ